MNYRSATRAATLAAAALLAGCASDGSGPFSTGSLASDNDKVAAAKANAACLDISSRIDALRKEGSIERLEKAADGKSTSVQVKRAALSKQAELNRAYAEYQQKCSTLPPTQTASIASTAPSTTTISKANAVTTTKAAAKP